ncbi:MAG: hypothetical protein HN929_10490, partial [Chloroflexi bacterium]|nr:hypothetical protein [Chloroflexota bacterium]
MYKYDKVGGEYVLSEDNQPVLTPGGNAFSTAYEDLAALLCNDLNEYGPNPFDSSSYVTLHTSYTDFGYAVEKSE